MESRVMWGHIIKKRLKKVKVNSSPIPRNRKWSILPLKICLVAMNG